MRTNMAGGISSLLVVRSPFWNFSVLEFSQGFIRARFLLSGSQQSFPSISIAFPQARLSRIFLDFASPIQLLVFRTLSDLPLCRRPPKDNFSIEVL